LRLDNGFAGRGKGEFAETAAGKVQSVAAVRGVSLWRA